MPISTLLLWAALATDITGCRCDPARPESMEAPLCGLCREAEKQPAGVPYFFLKDTNPLKPNRWLLLPRSHGPDGTSPLLRMTAAERTRLWTAAVQKARELWGDDWGIAINGDTARTQCHTHIHIGRLLKGVETDHFVVVDGPAQIPMPEEGYGLWIHPAGGKLHVHLGERNTETVLLR
ncbi:MAG: hypothetical protein ACLQGV_13710 [Bryobacteraceae bacterium]